MLNEDCTYCSFRYSQVKTQCLPCNWVGQDWNLSKVSFLFLKRLLTIIYPKKFVVFLKGFEKWETPISCPCNKSIQRRYTFGHTLNILDLNWRFHVQQCLDLLRIGINTSLVDHRPKVLPGRESKSIFGWIESHLILA